MNNRSVISLSAKALENNLLHYKNAIKGKLLGVVVKSNAYGHGLTQIGYLLEKNNLVDWLFVAALSEAVTLREQGSRKPILVMYHLDADPILLIIHDISIMATDTSTLLLLNNYGLTHKKKIKVHLKVDTGLSRFGISADQVLSLCACVNELQGIYLEGIYSHLAEAAKDSLFTKNQIELFDRVLSELEREKIEIPFKHIANSAAATMGDLGKTNLVRIGLGAYGIWPSEFTRAVTTAQHADFKLEPVLSWKSKIEFIRTIKSGNFVGYDRTFTATKDSTIAVVPVGYFDGYDRRLGNNAHVIVNGVHVPVIGRVAMTTMMIDITDVTAKIGDEVTLIGVHTDVHAVHLANLMQSYNPRELLTRIHEGICRVVEP